MDAVRSVRAVEGSLGHSSIEGNGVDEVRQVGILLSYTDWEAHEETARG
jgi:hypothetical protein